MKRNIVLKLGVLFLIFLTAACQSDVVLYPNSGGQNLSISGNAQEFIQVGRSYSFTPVVPAGLTGLSFSATNLPSWSQINVNTGTVSGTPSTNDVKTTSGIVVTVSMGDSSTSLDPFSISVTDEQDQSMSLSISGNAGASILVGQIYSFTPVVPDGLTGLVFSATNLPSWAQVDMGTGTLSGIPAAGDVGTSTGIVLSVTLDGTTVSLYPFSITVSQEQEQGQSLSISGSADTSVQVGQVYSFTPVVPDGLTGLVFSATNIPSWAQIDASTGTLSGTPAVGDEGTNPGIVVSVTMNSITASLDPFSISVNQDQALSIGGSPEVNAQVGQTYSFTPVVPDGLTGLSFSVTNLPVWAQLDTNTGTISGTPTVGDVNTTTGIVVSVTLGVNTVSLNPFSIAVCDSCIPVVLYTDVVSGPVSGGENDNGAYLSIFGLKLGSASGLGITTKVYINGTEVADYKYLGASYGRTDVQQLSVQVGTVTSGSIVVEVNGIPSNSDTTFTVQPGDIYYVSLAGNDAAGAANDISAPFRTLQDPTGSGVWKDHAGPGDFIVLRGGEWSDVGLDERFIRTKSNTGTAPDGNVGSGPITIMGYPGENVHIHSATRGGIHNRGNALEAKWVVVSNFRIEGGDVSVVDAPINLQWGSDYWRVVNNELFDWDAMATDVNGQRTQARAGGIAGNGNNMKIFGNNIHNIGGGTKNHGIYLDFDGNPTTVDNVEMAWNYIHNHTGGNIIQVYGSLGDITNVSIHHNLLVGGSRYGINLANGSDSHIYIYNNVIADTAFSAIRMDTNSPQHMYIYNNTLYNVDMADTTGALTNDYEMLGAIFEFKNNIVIPAPNSTQYIGANSGWDDAVIENNLWYGINASFARDINPVLNSNGNVEAPLFVDASTYNFRVESSSIAIDSGVIPQEVLNLMTDYELNSRSNGAAIDLGAFEYSQ